MLVFGFCYNNNLLDVYFYVSMRVLVVVVVAVIIMYMRNVY